MKHARTDYDRIQDPAGLIPENEPVFLIRGQDINAPKTLRAYAGLASSSGADPILVESILNQAFRMEEWQREEVQKIPDMPAEVILRD